MQRIIKKEEFFDGHQIITRLTIFGEMLPSYLRGNQAIDLCSGMHNEYERIYTEDWLDENEKLLVKNGYNVQKVINNSNQWYHGLTKLKEDSIFYYNKLETEPTKSQIVYEYLKIQFKNNFHKTLIG